MGADRTRSFAYVSPVLAISDDGGAGILFGYNSVAALVLFADPIKSFYVSHAPRHVLITDYLLYITVNEFRGLRSTFDSERIIHRAGCLLFRIVPLNVPCMFA